MLTPDDARIAADIHALLSERAADASICPSEIARRLYADDAWRDAMPDVRRTAVALAADGFLQMTQSEVVLDPRAPIVGPIRLRRGPRWHNSISTD